MRYPRAAFRAVVLASFALACGFIAACGRGDAATAPAKPAAQSAVNLDEVHDDTPGLAWFKGDTESAFAAAQASNKPVLLYWGAQWCPPCKQLKSAVFSRPDFIEKSKLFVAVYLDGDLPDAQKWGDVFRVTGIRRSSCSSPTRRRSRESPATWISISMPACSMTRSATCGR